MSTLCSTYPTVQRGNQGYYVRELQNRLKQHGYSLIVDGDFGSNTELAVKNFQHHYGLIVDGIVGSHTWKALCNY